MIVEAYMDFIKTQDGKDGQSYYTWIKYSKVENPTSSDLLDMPSDYMGIYTGSSSSAPTDPQRYHWYKIKGENGESITGPKGEDGISSYIHIKYSDDGGKTFTADNGTVPGDYMGVLVDSNPEAPLIVGLYTWQLVKGGQGIPGKTGYFHVAYSVNPDGNPITTSPTDDSRYMGTYFDFEQTGSSDYKKYTWTRIQGNDGIGINGKDGVSYYVWIKYAKTPDGEMSDNPDGMDYIGIASNKTSPVESNDNKDYTWSLFRGPTGAPGQNGEDGKTYYTWIKYANSPTPSASEISDTPEGMDYMGIAHNKETAQESTNYQDYQWIYIRGEEGIPGKDGIDGVSSYLHIKYSNDGGKTFTAGNGETLGTWIGVYVDETKADSNIPSKYQWKKYVGENGKDGVDGIGYTIALSNENHGFSADGDGIVKDSSIEFKVISWKGVTQIASNVTLPENIPAGMTVSIRSGTNGTLSPTIVVSVNKDLKATAGTLEFLVACEDITITKVWSYNVVRGGKDGEGVESSTVTYQVGNSGTIAPTGEWSNTIPSVPEGKYLWTRTITHYSNGADVASYSVSYQGTNGKDGENGSDGQDGTDGVGIIGIVNYYQLSSNGTVAPTGEWKTTVPTLTATNKYLWNYEVIEKTDKSTILTEKRVIGVYGDKGNTGAAGKGIKSILEYYLASTSSSGVTVSTPGWTTTVQTITSAKKYLWNYEVVIYTDDTKYTSSPAIIGAYGDKGATGANGKDGRGIQSVTNYYLASSSGSGVTPETAGWTTTLQQVSASKKYLWNYEKISYTDGVNPTTTSPSIISTYTIDGVNGKDGRGISSITEYYLASAQSSGVTVDTKGWTTTVQSTTDQIRYLWNYEKFTYTDSSSPTTTTPKIIGTQGTNGKDGQDGTDGVGIKSTVITYQAGNSGIDIPTGEWLSSVPNLKSGQFLWIRTITTYSNDTTSTSYSVSYHGKDGENGKAYGIETSTSFILANFLHDGFTPSTVTFTPYYQEGNDETKHGFTCDIEFKYSTDGASWQSLGRSSNVSSRTLNTDISVLNPLTKHVKCIIYANGKDVPFYEDSILVRDNTDENALLFVKESNQILIQGNKLTAGSVTTNKLAAESVTANKLAAESVTADKITTQNIIGDNGWINLSKGTFDYGGKLIWDGKDLIINGEVNAESGVIGGWFINADIGLTAFSSKEGWEPFPDIKDESYSSKQTRADVFIYPGTYDNIPSDIFDIEYKTVFRSKITPYYESEGNIESLEQYSKGFELKSNGAFTFGFLTTKGGAYVNDGPFVEFDPESQYFNSFAKSVSIAGEGIGVNASDNLYLFGKNGVYITSKEDPPTTRVMLVGPNGLISYSEVTSGQLNRFQEQIDNKAPSSHTHTNLYYGSAKVVKTYYSDETGNYGIIPEKNNAYVIGIPTYRWNRLFVVTANISGSVIVGGTTVHSSDRRMKAFVNSIDERYEKTFMELRPVTYMWKNTESNPNHDRIHCGFISQEVNVAAQKNGLTSETFSFICHDYLDNEEDGLTEKWGLAYNELHGLEVHMIQKAIRRIETLETENCFLKQQVEEILKKLNSSA
jgi:hypothetical protein